MASASKIVAVFCLLVLLALSTCSQHARADDEATKEKNEVMEYCKRYIRKNMSDPHPGYHRKCCQVLRESRNVHAICEKFTAADLQEISLAKFATVTHVCGHGLTPGTTCAGYTVPPPHHEHPPPPPSGHSV